MHLGIVVFNEAIQVFVVYVTGHPLLVDAVRSVHFAISDIVLIDNWPNRYMSDLPPLPTKPHCFRIVLGVLSMSQEKLLVLFVVAPVMS